MESCATRTPATRLGCAAAVLIAALFAPPARAGEGVIEINQVCANAGCFAGDAPGFPVTITGSERKSYRLTSDLVVLAFDVDLIEITGNHVSLDLNGFSIRCVGLLGACSGSGRGIDGDTASNVSVHGGTVQGAASQGVLLGASARVERVRALDNAANGIAVGDDSAISGCTASGNGQHGITAGVGSTITDNVANGNGSAGIRASSGSTVSRNTARQNGSVGIVAADGTTASGNTASNNGSDGISASSGTYLNGNTVRDNADYGLSIVDSTAYRENVISSNDDGTIIGGGVDLGSNSCNGSVTCP